MTDKHIVNMDLSKALEYAQSFYMVGDTVLVIGEDSNRGKYGKVSDRNNIYNSLRMREDWRKKLDANPNGRLEYMIVDFGSYHYKWSSFYHREDIVNVRLLGQFVAKEYLE